MATQVQNSESRVQRAPGRPAKKPGTVLNARHTFAMPQARNDEFLRAAEAAGLDISSFTRMAVLKHLDSGVSK